MAPKKNSTKAKIAGAHYDTLPVETIEIIESVVERQDLPRKAAYCIGNALKYICRAGLKQGEPWQDDLGKAENYLHRAVCGNWIESKKG